MQFHVFFGAIEVYLVFSEQSTIYLGTPSIAEVKKLKRSLYRRLNFG